ncbi:hypothetical protein HPB50_023566 [Hyalomma asiaticum]|uniref:Uncharacterized protein n=1 Tax=Hyalomma asiaticum TaxID=266040 RepID=A0ACB7T4G4_HYAAI|nr:hypothetical protein HPB50_023566 [Hyalomma asiaticum]
MTGRSNRTVNHIIQAYKKKAASATLHINGTLVQRLLLRTPTSSTPRRTRCDQKQRLWHPVKACHDPLYVQEVALSGRTAVNVWGAVSRDGLGVLHRTESPLTSAKYCDIFDYIMIPYALDGPFPDGDFLFQQDASPAHTAKVVEELLNMRGVWCLRWVPKGTELNIIEAVWGRMKGQAVQKRITQFIRR